MRRADERRPSMWRADERRPSMWRADERRPYMSLGLRCNLVIALVVLGVSAGCCDSRREKAEKGKQGRAATTEVAAPVGRGTDSASVAAPAAAPVSGENATAEVVGSPEATALRAELKEVEQRIIAASAEFHGMEEALRAKHPDVQKAFEELNASRERYQAALAQMPEYVAALKKVTDVEDVHAELRDRIVRLERGTRP